MSTTYYGRVAIAGIEGTMAYTGYGSVAIPTTAGALKSVGMTSALDTVALMDKGNEVVGIAIRNARKEVTVEFTPTNDSADDTPTLTETRNLQRLPLPGSLVTLAGFGATEINDNYNYFGGGTINNSQEGHVTMTLPLVKYAAGAFVQVT